MKLYNSLTKQKEEFKPIQKGHASVYSCGPTVYDHVHIGNLRAFVVSDLLVRILKANNFDVTHVMNITDIDDKMIERSQQEYPDLEANQALKQLAEKYTKAFTEDTEEVGVDLSGSKLPKATKLIGDMSQYIAELLDKKIAYSAEDGIYFDLSKYRESSDYGVLAKVDTSKQRGRIAADEYDKDQASDFALWKAAKAGEPSWSLKTDDIDMPGRPGWHIECSVMSTKYLGQPFDIHTGGVDLKFPHHENEIAQSRAHAGDELANYFVHNEHILVDGKKMSKSLGNFLTLEDIARKGHDPIAFRLLVLQSHYRHQQNFTWEALEGAQAFLQRLRAMADRQFQASSGHTTPKGLKQHLKSCYDDMVQQVSDDLNSPQAISRLGELADYIDTTPIDKAHQEVFTNALKFIDALLGLDLANRKDIAKGQHDLLAKRESARDARDYQTADKLRSELEGQEIGLNDTPHDTYWYRT